MAHILMTGASGFIGRRLVQALSDRHTVYAVARRPQPSDEATGAVWIEQDLAQPLDTTGWPAQIDAIIHLAQSARYREFPAGAQDIFDVNIAGTFRLLEYARQADVQRFIYASTGGIDDLGYDTLTQSDVPGPLDFYRSSKYVAELLIANYRASFLTCACRLYFVYGKSQPSAMLIPRLVESVLSERPILLRGPDGIHLNPVHVRDVVAALEGALSLEHHTRVEIGGPEILSLRMIAETIGQHLGVSPRFDTQPEAGPSRVVANIDRMIEQLGKPTVSFEEGVAEICRETRR